MKQVKIYESESLAFGSQSNFGGIYGRVLVPTKFTLELGKEYLVEWDGNAYACSAQDFSVASAGAVAIGNAENWGGSPSDTPFAIAYVPAENINLLLAVDGSTATAHAVTIYQVVEDKGVIVKDRTGADVEHIGAVGVRVRALDGGTKEFVDADALPSSVETSVDLDFSAGDMEVSPGDGKVFSKITIPTPATLIPDNIAEGVNIAGIIGSFGDSSKIKIAIGIDTSTSVGRVIQHGLGVVPDIIYLQSTSLSRTSEATVYFSSFSVTRKFKELSGLSFDSGCFNCTSTGTQRLSRYTADIEADSAYPLCNVNENSFQAGSYTYGRFYPGAEVYWIAIGGLT